MANKNMPCGFIPYGELKRSNAYTASGTVYPGDPVKLVSSGKVSTISAGDACAGVALNYATDGNSVSVADDPDQLFEAQSSGTTAANGQTDVGNCIDALMTAADSTYKTSRAELDISTLATTAAGFQIVGFLGTAGSDNKSAANARYVVRINKHQFYNLSGIAGV